VTALSKSKAAANERMKLAAVTLNTAGLAVFGLSVLSPVFAGQAGKAVLFRMALGIAIFIVLHGFAQLVLGRLRD
jgi:hypothetical protein